MKKNIKNNMKDKIISKKELDFVLQEGEGQYVEFKESFDNKNFAKEVVAFANASGGKIFLGVSDVGKVNGIEILNKLKSQIQDIVKNCDPPINCNLSVASYLQRDILVIEIIEGKNKPYSCSSGFYLRIGPNSQKMKRDEILKMFSENSQFKFDDSYLREEDNFSYSNFKDFLKQNGISSDLELKDILKSMKLINFENKFSNASILLFGDDVQSVFPSAYLECVLFKGDNRSEVLDRKRIEGNLFDQVNGGMIFLKKHLKVRYEFPGEKRKEFYDVPLRALEEALVNALIHRDYSINGANISLFIYGDRVEIISPGGLVLGFDKNDFGKISIRRNELIAEIFSKTKYVEKIGSGVGRMRDLCLKQNNPLPVFDFGNFFIITFPFGENNGLEGVNEGVNGETKDMKRLSEVDEKLTQVDEKLTQRLSDKEKEILFFMLQNKKINSGNLQKLFGISREMANRYFKKLMDEKLIFRKGKSKLTYYILGEGFK